MSDDPRYVIVPGSSKRSAREELAAALPELAFRFLAGLVWAAALISVLVGINFYGGTSALVWVGFGVACSYLVPLGHRATGAWLDWLFPTQPRLPL